MGWLDKVIQGCVKSAKIAIENFQPSILKENYCVQTQAKASKRRLKPATTSIYKKKIFLTFAIPLSPFSARSLLKEKSYQAVKRINEIKPVKLEGPCELVVEYLSSADAFINYQKSTIEKVSPTTIKVSGENFFEMWKRYFLR